MLSTVRVDLGERPLRDERDVVPRSCRLCVSYDRSPRRRARRGRGRRRRPSAVRSRTGDGRSRARRVVLACVCSCAPASSSSCSLVRLARCWSTRLLCTTRTRPNAGGDERDRERRRVATTVRRTRTDCGHQPDRVGSVASGHRIGDEPVARAADGLDASRCRTAGRSSCAGSRRTPRRRWGRRRSRCPTRGRGSRPSTRRCRPCA